MLFGDQQLDLDLAAILSLQTDPAADAPSARRRLGTATRKQSIRAARNASVTIAMALGFAMTATTTLVLKSGILTRQWYVGGVSASSAPAVAPAMETPSPAAISIVPAKTTIAFAHEEFRKRTVRFRKPHRPREDQSSGPAMSRQMASAAALPATIRETPLDIAPAHDGNRAPASVGLVAAIPALAVQVNQASDDRSADPSKIEAENRERRRDSVAAIRALRRQ
jgi:hypothetical protein